MKRSGLLIALALLLAPTTAEASPWTLPEHAVAVRVGADYQYARREFMLDGALQPYSLRGRFDGAHLRADVRYGVTDRFEIGGGLSLDYVHYGADELYLGDIFTTEVGDEGSPERYRANLLSLDQTATGLGDLRLYGRYRLTGLGRALAAVEVQLKVPTGYRAPTGTFRDDTFSEGVGDDVTIGDGQLDAELRVLSGFLPLWSWFVRIDAGFRARTFGASHQVLGAIKTGYRVVDVWLPYAFADLQYAVTEGRVIGTSYVTDVPETPAAEFTADLLVPAENRLERSALQVGGGMIFSLGDRDIDLSYAYTVWGENMSQLHVVSLSTALVF